MRVLHLIDTYWIGGAQVLLKNFAESRKSTYPMRVYALRKTGIQCIKEKDDFYCDASSSMFSIGRFFRLRKEVLSFKPTILHCHLPHAQLMGLLLKFTIKPSVKLVFHEHTDIYEGGIKGFILKNVFRLFKNKVAVFIAVSEGTKRQLISKCKIDSSAIKVLYNFIDYSKIKAIKKAASTEITLGFAARMVKRKGWHFIPEIALQLKNESVQFIVAGDGPDLNSFKNIVAEKKLENQIEFLGFQQDMQSFYSRIDALLLLSEYEGNSLVQLEAMAMGIPIIAFDVDGVNEWKVYNYTKLVTFANIEKVVKAIQELRSSNTIEVQNVSNVLKEKCSIDNFDGMLTSIYKQI